MLSKLGRAAPTIIYPGAGIFFWWQAGAISELGRRFDLHGGNVHAVGASAGALSAALGACAVDMDRAYDVAFGLCEESNVFDRGPWGLYGVWGPIIRTWLDELLPVDAADVCRGRVAVAVTAVPRLRQPAFERVLLDDYRDRADLIDALCASVHVPIFLDRQWTASLRGERYVDGSLADAVRGAAHANGYQRLAPLDARSPSLLLNYRDDERMRTTFSRTEDFLRLASPAGVVQMKEWGAEHVRAMDEEGRLAVLEGVRLGS